MSAVCIIDRPSFERLEIPEGELDLNAIGLTTIYDVVYAQQILDIPMDGTIFLTADSNKLGPNAGAEVNLVTGTINVLGVFRLRTLAKHLAHELVHIQQIHQKWLVYDNKTEQLLWFGIPMAVDLFDDDFEGWSNHPWERHALANEKRVYKQIVKAIERIDT